MPEVANNAWVVQAPKQTAQVPVGNYMATFKEVEDYKIADGSIKWRWEWEITTGQQKGQVASALTDQSISSATLPGRLIEGLLNRKLIAGEHVKEAIDACKGKSYLVSVLEGPKGGKPCVRVCGQPPAM